MQIVEEYLENAIDGYPHITLRIIIHNVGNITIVIPLIFDHNDKMLPYNMQHKAKDLLSKVIDDEMTHRWNL